MQDIDRLASHAYNVSQDAPVSELELSVLYIQWACLFLLAGLGGVANAVVIVVLYRRPALRTLSNRYILSLVIANLFTCLLVLPDQFLRQSFPYVHWCHALRLIMFGASVYSVLLISLDRFLAVENPLHYNHAVTRRKGVFLILGGWTFAAALALPGVLPTEIDAVGWLKLAHSCVLLLSCFVFPLISLIYIYVRLYKAARLNVMRTRKHSISSAHYEMTTPTHSSAHSDVIAAILATAEVNQPVVPTATGVPLNLVVKKSASLRRKFACGDEKRAVYTSLLVILSFTLCWAPFYVELVLGYVTFGTLLMAYSHSLISACIYVYRNPVARTEAAKLLCRHGTIPVPSSPPITVPKREVTKSETAFEFPLKNSVTLEYHPCKTSSTPEPEVDVSKHAKKWLMRTRASTMSAIQADSPPRLKRPSEQLILSPFKDPSNDVKLEEEVDFFVVGVGDRRTVSFSRFQSLNIPDEEERRRRRTSSFSKVMSKSRRVWRAPTVCEV